MSQSKPAEDCPITTEKPDDLFNPLMVTPLSPPEDILSPVIVNMHAEEKQNRKIAWIMDDLSRDIAKLRVIFVERLTEPTEKVPESWKTRAAPDMSHEILKNLSAISDWLSEINIDGEAFALPIGEEEMKYAQEKPMERKQYIEEEAGNMQFILEEVVEKALKLTKFISGRQNVLDKFAEYLGDKSATQQMASKTESELLGNILESLQKAELENYEEVEKLLLDYEDSLTIEKENSIKLKEKITTMTDEIVKYQQVLKMVSTIKALTMKFIKESETMMAKVISDESIRLAIAGVFTEFRNNFNKEVNSIEGVGRTVGFGGVKKNRKSSRKSAWKNKKASIKNNQ